MKWIDTICHWLGCDEYVAERILDGVFFYHNDYYSAFEKDNKLIICKNGQPIHRIGKI